MIIEEDYLAFSLILTLLFNYITFEFKKLIFFNKAFIYL